MRIHQIHQQNTTNHSRSYWQSLLHGSSGTSSPMQIIHDEHFHFCHMAYLKDGERFLSSIHLNSPNLLQLINIFETRQHMPISHTSYEDDYREELKQELFDALNTVIHLRHVLRF
ncbi:hypothetical protein SprV_0200707100 [Sparganum proliferum]